MDTLAYILQNYTAKIDGKLPVEIPNTNRETLAGIFSQLEFKVGAEIGTLTGEYAEMICRANPKVKLYCVDPYVVYKGHRQHKDQGELNKFENVAKVRLKPYNVEFVKEFSVDAAKRFPIASLDFVYIDANHRFRNVIDDIDEWYPRIRPGGIIAGHDFIQRKNSRHQHVVEAVISYTSIYKINPWFVLGRKQPSENEFRDRFRSWFWVVP